MLVLRPGALGDTLLAVPALRALRRRFGRVSLAAHAGAARLLAALGEVDDGFGFDDAALHWVFDGGAAVPHPPVVAWLAAGRELPGLRDALLVAPGRPASPDQHCARYLLETLAPLGCDTTLLDERPLGVVPLAAPEILIHPGSGSRAKNWPAARFSALIAALGEAGVRLIVGEADAEAAAAVQAGVGRRLPRLEQPALPELAVRLAGCRGYLGNDSGVSHLAGLSGSRCLVLFGPTSPRTWRPLGPRVEVLPFDTDPREVATRLLRS